MAFMRWDRDYLGYDSSVARTQATPSRASTELHIERRILCRFFWFRSWSRPVMTIFWVSNDMNPADPASRAFDFRSNHEIRRNADMRFRAWKFAHQHPSATFSLVSSTVFL